MCGIAGKLFFDPEARVEEIDVARMLDPISHRGPDGRGIHLDGNLGLGHVRLSIIDLNAGAQPMANEDETIWITFNGEIYNFPELRSRLLDKGHVFRSHCDTEVIIHLYEELGEDCVRELRGMFAFAIWDSKRQRLFLARDRVGIKPLYFCQTPKVFYFASELKSIIANSAVSRETCPLAIRKFFSYLYVPGEETLFRSVKKLLPGHHLMIEKGQVKRKQYWDLQFTTHRSSNSFEDVVEELHGLLRDTVRDHMIADVPVGFLLSGGVDSSAMLSFANQNTNKQVKAFTIGFSGNQVVDERPYARMAAQRFGVEHYEISITADDFWNFLPAYVWHMEEPVSQPPAVALHYVSKLARDHVKVLLSGEGGDEAFAGYPNYPNMMRLDRVRAAVGPFARSIGSMAELAGRVSGDERLERYGSALGWPLASYYFSRGSSPTSFFNRHAKSFFTTDFLRNTAEGSPAANMRELLGAVPGESLLNQMLYVDTKTWLPDSLLLKADKMTMANSLELRVPLLDHKVLEFAASLSSDAKIRGKYTKRVLKAVFDKTLPREILDRKKAGFPLPYDAWLQGKLAVNVCDILLSSAAQSRGYINRSQILRLLETHKRTGRYAREIFSLVVLEMWHLQFIDKLSEPAGLDLGIKSNGHFSLPQ